MVKFLMLDTKCDADYCWIRNITGLLREKAKSPKMAERIGRFHVV